jgi:hypothetical protein
VCYNGRDRRSSPLHLPLDNNDGRNIAVSEFAYTPRTEDDEDSGWPQDGNRRFVWHEEWCNMLAGRGALECWDCGRDTTRCGHYYMLMDSLWYEIASWEEEILCLDCCEARLGARLTEDMFYLTPVEIERRGNAIDSGLTDEEIDKWTPDPPDIRQMKLDIGRLYWRWIEP